MLVWKRFFWYYVGVKKIALNLLVGLARRILVKSQPRIIGVTGSVGKTTTKEAIYTALRGSFRVARSLKNANTEWGATATILDQNFHPQVDGLGRAKITPGQMVRLVWQGCRWLMRKGGYPEILILELAADRPGDIKFFNRLLQYNIAVITNIGQVHLEFYKDQTELTAEKLALADGLKTGGLLVLNGDNDLMRDFVQTTSSRKVTFGWEDTNDYFASVQDVTVEGLRFEMHTPKGDEVMAFGFGRQIIPAVLVGLAVGQELGIPLQVMTGRLASFGSLTGRFEMEYLNRGIMLVNDAYNANPDSMKSALTSLQDIASIRDEQGPPSPRRRRVAILGGMRELGSAHDSAHREVGRFLRDKVDLLIAIGGDGMLMAEAAQTSGLTENQIILVPEIGQVDFSKFLQDNDAVLVKASRSFGLDKVAQLIKQRIGK